MTLNEPLSDTVQLTVDQVPRNDEPRSVGVTACRQLVGSAGYKVTETAEPVTVPVSVPELVSTDG